MAQLNRKEFEQLIREKLSREQILLVAGYIELASKELTKEMVYADGGADKLMRMQGEVRGYEEVVRRLRRVHDEKQ